MVIRTSLRMKPCGVEIRTLRVYVRQWLVFTHSGNVALVGLITALSGRAPWVRGVFKQRAPTGACQRSSVASMANAI